MDVNGLLPISPVAAHLSNSTQLSFLLSSLSTFFSYFSILSAFCFPYMFPLKLLMLYLCRLEDYICWHWMSLSDTISKGDCTATVPVPSRGHPTHTPSSLQYTTGSWLMLLIHDGSCNKSRIMQVVSSSVCLVSECMFKSTPLSVFIYVVCDCATNIVSLDSYQLAICLCGCHST